MESLATEIMRQKENKADYIVYVNGLYVEACGGDLILHVLDGNGTDRIEPLDMGDYAHRQISAYLNIPAKYYSRMLNEYPELLTKNVNGWFSRTNAQRMLRVLDGKMRAFVSNRYMRIDHHEVICTGFYVIFFLYAYTPDLVRDTFSPAASVYPAQIGFSVVAKRCAQKSRKLVLQYIVIG